MTERTCSNCACYTEITLSPLTPPTGQCRRNIGQQVQIQIETPRLMDNKPVIGKDGKPVINKTVEARFLYAPTLPTSVCFDGWRPLETLPGENAQTRYFKTALNIVYGKLGIEETTLTRPDHDN